MWLQQYYQIRERCFQTDLGLVSFDGSENEYDRRGLVLIARDGDKCVGGARISGRTRDHGRRLPLEQEGLDLQSWFPQLKHRCTAYCQWSRMALLPEYRAVDILREFCKATIGLSLRQGYEYAFNVAGMKQARLYKRLHSSLDRDYRIFQNIPVPVERSFVGLPHLLSVTYLREHCPEIGAVASGNLARVA